MAKKINQRDRQREINAAAMPEVKRLVKKYGRRAVGNCLGKLKEHEKGLDRLSALKKQVEELERSL